MNNRLSLLENKNIVLLGLGLTGLSCARFLAGQHYRFSANDSRATAVEPRQFQNEFPGVALTLGHWDSEMIANAEVLLVSPGIDLSLPAFRQYISAQCQIIGDVELFCRLTDAKIIAVTGSNGKSTVVSLLAHMAEFIGVNAELAGNIGLPALDCLNRNCDYAILELSSFQLESTHSLHAVAATILNVSDDHLDRHKTMANYQQIKQRIYQHCDTVVCNRDDALTVAPTGDANRLSFGSDRPEAGDFGLALLDDEMQLVLGTEQGLQPLLPVRALAIAGVHNALNCLAALALGHAAGWPLGAMVQSLPTFAGLPHRCQRVASGDGILWINDSKATNVGATIAAIEGLAPTLAAGSRLLLLAGGEGKGADFSPLAVLMRDKVAELITFGKDGAAIAGLFAGAHQVASLADAVAMAKSLATAGDMVLLSPACASLDMFNNYIERGECFAAEVGRVSHG